MKYNIVNMWSLLLAYGGEKENQPTVGHRMRVFVVSKRVKTIAVKTPQK